MRAKSFLISILLGVLASAPSTLLAQEHRGGEHHGDWHGGGDWHGHGSGWGGNSFGNAFGSIVGGAIVGGAIRDLFYPPPPVVIQQPVYIPAPVPAPVPEIVPYSGEWYRYCAQKYRSFDAATGTYLGFDGARHQCQ